MAAHPADWHGPAEALASEMPTPQIFLARPPRKIRPTVVHERGKTHQSAVRVEQSNTEHIQFGTFLVEVSLQVVDFLLQPIAASSLRPGQPASLPVEAVLFGQEPSKR